MNPLFACIGTATLDIVNQVNEYPREDSEVRALSQVRRMGGNAANTAIVLGQLGHPAAWIGNLAQSSSIIDNTFALHGVDATRAVRIAHSETPTSYITLSNASGSRSIVHFRNMPEYHAADFLTLDLAQFGWIHFEGRAVDQLSRMMAHASSQSAITISLEVEKPRAGIEALIEYADLVMFSRDYAIAREFTDAQGLLASLEPGTVATCTWGSKGAWAIDQDGRLLHATAPILDQVIDSVGAGDVFNAALISRLHHGDALETALVRAVSLASSQCARQGLDLKQQHGSEKT